MTTEMVTIMAIVCFVAFVALSVFLYFREHTLEQIRADVYQLFLEAEHQYRQTEAGKQKMEYVIQRAQNLLPVWARFFITDKLLKKVIQMWFDAVKDLLDDGKYNQSIKGNSE